MRRDFISNPFRRWIARSCEILRFCAGQQPRASVHNRSPLFVVIEGPRDAEFLRRISHVLHRHDPAMPNLADMEADGRLVFVPFGGGDVRSWAFRLAGTGAAEFHLYDREMSPETEVRLQVARVVNQRPGCRAYVTTKRALENYVETEAIFDVCGVRIEYADQEDIAEKIARSLYAIHHPQDVWDQLPARTRKRRRDQVKRLLNTRAAIEE